MDTFEAHVSLLKGRVTVTQFKEVSRLETFGDDTAGLADMENALSLIQKTSKAAVVLGGVAFIFASIVGLFAHTPWQVLWGYTIIGLLLLMIFVLGFMHVTASSLRLQVLKRRLVHALSPPREALMERRRLIVSGEVTCVWEAEQPWLRWETTDEVEVLERVEVLDAHPPSSSMPQSLSLNLLNAALHMTRAPKNGRPILNIRTAEGASLSFALDDGFVLPSYELPRLNQDAILLETEEQVALIQHLRRSAATTHIQLPPALITDINAHHQEQVEVEQRLDR